MSGRSAAWLARLVRDQEVDGSNPFAPTTSISLRKFELRDIKLRLRFPHFVAHVAQLGPCGPQKFRPAVFNTVQHCYILIGMAMLPFSAFCKSPILNGFAPNNIFGRHRDGFFHCGSPYPERTERVGYYKDVCDLAQAKGLPSMIYHELVLEVRFMRAAAGTTRILTIRVLAMLGETRGGSPVWDVEFGGTVCVLVADCQRPQSRAHLKP